MSQDEELIERAANIAYRVCAETRHVTLGDKAANAIRAELQPADRLEALAQPVVGVADPVPAFEDYWGASKYRSRNMIGYSDKKCLAWEAYSAALAASPSPVVPRLPLMSAAFRTTISGDGYRMDFKFPSIEALHAADDEWRAFRKDEQCTLGYAKSADTSVPVTTGVSITTDAPVVGDEGRRELLDKLEWALNAYKLEEERLRLMPTLTTALACAEIIADTNAKLGELLPDMIAILSSTPVTEEREALRVMLTAFSPYADTVAKREAIAIGEAAIGDTSHAK